MRRSDSWPYKIHCFCCRFAVDMTYPTISPPMSAPFAGVLVLLLAGFDLESLDVESPLSGFDGRGNGHR